MEVSRTACKFGFRWNFASHGSWVRRLFYFQKNKSAALANSYAAGFAVGWISTFLVRSRELFAPKMSEIGLCRLRMSRSFLQGLCRAVSRMSRGAIAGNHQQHFFDPIGSNKITISDRIENIVSNPVWVKYDYNLRSDRKNYRHYFFDPTPIGSENINYNLRSCRKNHRQHFFRSNWVQYDYSLRSDRKNTTNRWLQLYLTQLDRKKVLTFRSDRRL